MIPKKLERVAILVGAVVVGLALLLLVFKSVFFLFRLALIAAVIGAVYLVVKAVQNAWRKSRCDRCAAYLTATEYAIAMPRERLRILIGTGNLEAVTGLFRPRIEGEQVDVIARVRTCERCGGTTWLGIYGTDGEILLEEQKRPAP